MNITASLAREVGVRTACCSLDVSRAGFYRWQHPREKEHSCRLSPLALSFEERSEVLDLLHTDRFIDKAPREIYANLLDEKSYLCSVRTLYRILETEGELKERRRQVSRPHYTKPEILAKAPNEAWSWDITKLKGPVKWTYFYLYVILDIYSRYVVGWMVAHRETAVLARKLIAETCTKQMIQPDQLLIHADRGSSMTSKPVALLMADLGVTKSHSRPSVSNDNPYSEAQFKTMKYRPDFPERFGSIQDARAFCQTFFPWYNTEHYHSGLGLLTPGDVHYGRASGVIADRKDVLLAAYAKHPERFKGRIPKPASLPEAVWINKPSSGSDGEVH
jgi:putative transposase